MQQVSADEFENTKYIETLFKQYHKDPYFFLSWFCKIIDKSKRGNTLYGVDTHRRYFYVQYPNGLVSTYSQYMKKKLPPLVLINWRGTTGRLLKILYYYDPSTKNPYVSFVPNEINKADEAMAWKFHLTPEEYDRLNIEA
mgnify:FL=1